MDHELLLAAERASEIWLRRAIAALALSDYCAAERALLRSLSMRRDPLAEALLGFLRVDSGETAFDGLRSTVAPAEQRMSNDDP
jgi:hypothetical protein